MKIAISFLVAVAMLACTSSVHGLTTSAGPAQTAAAGTTAGGNGGGQTTVGGNGGGQTTVGGNGGGQTGDQQSTNGQTQGNEGTQTTARPSGSTAVVGSWRVAAMVAIPVCLRMLV